MLFVVLERDVIRFFFGRQRLGHIFVVWPKHLPLLASIRQCKRHDVPVFRYVLWHPLAILHAFAVNPYGINTMLFVMFKRRSTIEPREVPGNHR
jgi:hypothetical protein